MIEIYGRWVNRTHRCLWMLEELGLEYELRGAYAQEGEPPTPHVVRGQWGFISPEVFALNPNARVPVLRDGDTVVWESLAINLYLATRYPSPLSPATPQEWGHAFQWSQWATSEIEDPLYRRVQILRDVGLSDAPPELVAEAEERARQLERPLAALETSLQGREYLIGDRFTVADLNAATVLSFSLAARIDYAPFPRARRWLGTCLGRPAARKVTDRVIADGRSLGYVGDLEVPDRG